MLFCYGGNDTDMRMSKPRIFYSTNRVHRSSYQISQDDVESSIIIFTFHVLCYNSLDRQTCAVILQFLTHQNIVRLSKGTLSSRNS